MRRGRGVRAADYLRAPWSLGATLNAKAAGDGGCGAVTPTPTMTPAMKRISIDIDYD
jgi:hypothetical protein